MSYFKLFFPFLKNQVNILMLILMLRNGSADILGNLFCFALLPYLRILDGWQYYIVWHAEICMWLYLVLYILIMIPILKFAPKKKNDL